MPHKHYSPEERRQIVCQYANSFAKIIYDDRFCKLYQVSYCHISGASLSDKDGLILFPGSLYINGFRINSIHCHGEDWFTDAESNNKPIGLQFCESLQVDHQSSLKKIGLTRELSKILKSTFAYQDDSVSIAGTISALIFARERTGRFIRLIPNRANLRDPLWGIRPIEYFEYQVDRWAAMCKHQLTSTGHFQLL